MYSSDMPSYVKTGTVLMCRCVKKPFFLGRILAVDRVRQRVYCRFEDDITHWCHFTNIQQLDCPSDRCCLCGSSARSSSDVIVCSTCGLGFHSRCHNPMIADAAVRSSVARWQCRLCVYRQTASPNGVLSCGMRRRPSRTEKFLVTESPKKSLWKQTKCKVDNSKKTEDLSVINIEDDSVVMPEESAPQEICSKTRLVPKSEILVAENENEAAARSPAVDGRSSRSGRVRNRLCNYSTKSFGYYQLEYAHWLHMSGYHHRAAKRRRHILKHTDVDLARRRSLEVARRRQMKVGLSRRQPIASSRPTKLLQLDSSDRPAIKSAGLTASRAPVNLLRFPRNVVDTKTVDTTILSSDERGITDGVRSAVQLHFGAMARIKAGAKCRIMARRWTTDDRLEYLVQWDAGIVT